MSSDSKKTLRLSTKTSTRSNTEQETSKRSGARSLRARARARQRQLDRSQTKNLKPQESTAVNKGDRPSILTKKAPSTAQTKAQTKTLPFTVFAPCPQGLEP